MKAMTFLIVAVSALSLCAQLPNPKKIAKGAGKAAGSAVKAGAGAAKEVKKDATAVGKEVKKDATAVGKEAKKDATAVGKKGASLADKATQPQQDAAKKVGKEAKGIGKAFKEGVKEGTGKK